MRNLKTLNWLFLVLCLFFTGRAIGQECRLIEVPGKKVNAFSVMDEAGFLWLSSLDGWYRHDGNNYKHYTAPIEADSTEYWQTIQSTLYTDQQGRKWYTSYGGLHFYNPTKDAIENVPLKTLGNQAHTGLHIIHHQPRTDKLTLIIDDQIYSFQPSTRAITPLGIHTLAKRFAVDTFPDGTIRTLIGCLSIIGNGIEVHHRISPDSSWKKTQIEALSNNLFTSVNGAVYTSNQQAYLATKKGIIAFRWQVDTVLNEITWKSTLIHPGGNTFSPVLNSQGNEMFFSQPFAGIATVPVTNEGLADFSRMKFDSNQKSILELTYHNSQQLWGWKIETGLVGITIPLTKNPQAGRANAKLAQTPLPNSSPLQAIHESGVELMIIGNKIDSVYRTENTLRGKPFSAFQKYNNGEIDYIRYLGNDLLVAAFNSSYIKTFNWTGTSITELDKISIGTDINCVSRESRRRELWIGTPKGLYFAKGQRAKLVLGANEGLGNLSITAIVPWKENWLILGSNRGIVLYNTEKDTPIWAGWCNELLAAPVKTDQISLPSPYGTLTFRSKQGDIEFNPDQIRLDAAALQPYILDYSINFIPQKRPLLLGKDTEIKLNSAQNTLAFQVSTLGFDFAKGATVTAEMIGSDLKPKSYPVSDQIYYSNLSTGRHELRLTAYNGRGEKGESRTLTISILAPLWQRPWFLTLIGILLVGTTYFLLHLRTRRQLREAAIKLRRQQAITAERERIAAELHDDLGGDLASMAFIIDGHNSLKELGIDSKLDVSRLGQLANGAIRHMREMIWVLDDEQATLPTLAKQLLANAREMAATGDLTLQADIPNDLPELHLSSIQKKNILLIAKEAMQNVRKHAKASAFSLRLAVEREGERPAILLVITDNGKGLTTTQSSKEDAPLNHGHGLKNLHKRAREINAELSLTPALPRGTKVTLKAPIGQ